MMRYSFLLTAYNLETAKLLVAMISTGTRNTLNFAAALVLWEMCVYLFTEWKDIRDKLKPCKLEFGVKETDKPIAKNIGKFHELPAISKENIVYKLRSS